MSDFGTSRKISMEMNQAVDEMIQAGKSTRRGFERRWYDNNFFYDGYHFRYMSRQTNKIVDLSERANLYYPMRAIPKASKQVQGIANLLTSSQYVPVVYPERVDKSAFSDEEYKLAYDLAKKIALKTGHWLMEEWKKQEILEKLTYMILLSCRHNVSFLKIWPDADKEAINTSVRDAFDCYCLGYLNEIYDSPFFIETQPRLLNDIKNDEMFPEELRNKIVADNKQSDSDIKDAYQRARFGMKSGTEASVTVVQREAFIKERINDANLPRIKMQEDADKVLKGKQKGDIILRQCITAGGVTLLDRYTALKEYPYVDLRLEPGPIYQTSIIERFIPQNKSLDMVVSRIERYTNTMAVGAWIKRQGEQIEFNNQAGGQVIEYAQTPPVQAQIAPLPSFIFNFVSLLSSYIDEQGVSLSTLGKMPAGVKGYQAIESLKESEYSNLVIASSRLRQCIRRISKRMLEYADEYFVKPQEIKHLEKGDPSYFDVIGASALKGRRELKVETKPDVIPLDSNSEVDIQVESGLGYTKEGQKASAKELGDYMIQLANAGYLPQEAVKVFIEKLLETYQFGNMKEFMEAMDSAEVIGGLSPKQIDAMKLAMAEVMKDLSGSEILPNQQQRIDENKLGMAEAIKDTGLVTPPKAEGDKGPSRSISFKDLPPIGQEQLAAQAGIQISAQELEAKQEADKQQESQMAERQLQIKEQSIKNGGASATTKG